MTAAFVLLAALVFRPCLWAQQKEAPPPTFATDSIVNSANGSSASLAPNVLATIYGSNLAYSTGKVLVWDIGGGELPTRLADVRITVAGIFVPLLYVSPTKIDFLLPSNLLPGPTDLVVQRQGAVARARINLLEVAPALFTLGDERITATHADGSLLLPDAPALPGETILVFGTGVGRTDPRQVDGYVPRAPAQIVLLDRLSVLLDGQPLPGESILYAGITPGFPGLYQIKLRLPDQIANPRPELRIALDDQMSQSDVVLQIAPGEP